MVVTTSLSEFRKRMKQTADEVCDHHVTLVVTRRNGPNLVVMSEDDYHALDETRYLLGTPNNVAHIDKALREKGGTSFESISALKQKMKLR